MTCKYCENLQDCIKDANLNGCEHNPDFEGKLYCSSFKRVNTNCIVVSRWIPVKERTPTESDGTVWVCLADIFPYNEKESYINAKHDKRITEAHYSEFSKRWYKDGAIYPDGVVTHWMEKPEPPKGD